MCRALEVSPSAYYDWLQREPSERQRRRDELTQKLLALREEFKGIYGSPRLARELRIRGEDVCENTVANILKSLGIRSIMHRKFRVSTTDSKHNLPVADNIVDRDFSAEAPDQVWLADITQIPTHEGKLYLAVVEDMCTRRIVGWSMDTSMESRLVVDALEMAIKRRKLGEGLVAHSDRGSQYASGHYQTYLSKHGILCSMSRKGDCWDNAPMESFFATLKKELVHHEQYATFAEAKVSIFEYIEVFYNRIRLHSALDYRSPETFESDEYS
jgi:putative transposase